MSQTIFLPFHGRVFERSIRILGLLCIIVSSLSAQSRRDSGDQGARFMERIDADEGAERIASFRSQRLDGDFRFEFILEHLPQFAEKFRYSGTMWGSWNERGAISRFSIEIPREDGGPAGLIELIIQSGLNPEVWLRKKSDESFRLIEKEALFEPIVPGIVYTPFDLLMPFIYWTDYTYVGPTRKSSRVAQQFDLFPPEDSIYASRGITKVRVGLDNEYDTLLFVEVNGKDSEPKSRFSVEGWKKVDGRYIVKTISLEDLDSSARTRFIVEEAEVGLSLDPGAFFNPDTIVEVR